MILRLSDSLSRGLIVVISFVLAVLLSFFSIRMALAARAADKETTEGFRSATRMEPQNAVYWYRFAHFEQFNLEETDPGQAKDLLKTAVRLDPKYTDAWLDLATAYELDGNAEEARDAYQHAKRATLPLLMFPGDTETSCFDKGMSKALILNFDWLSSLTPAERLRRFLAVTGLNPMSSKY